jgi:hypothetical protein
MYCPLFQDAAVRCVTKYDHLYGTLKAVRMWPEGVTNIALALELPHQVPDFDYKILHHILLRRE